MCVECAHRPGMRPRPTQACSGKPQGGKAHTLNCGNLPHSLSPNTKAENSNHSNNRSRHALCRHAMPCHAMLCHAMPPSTPPPPLPPPLLPNITSHGQIKDSLTSGPPGLTWEFRSELRGHLMWIFEPSLVLEASQHFSAVGMVA